MRKIIPILALIFFLTSCGKTTPETILTPGNDTVAQFEEYIPQTCFLSTSEGSYQMAIDENTVDTEVLGTYYVKYTYTFDEVKYTSTRMVFVTDQTSPNVELNPGIDSVKIGDQWIDSSVTYSDDDTVLDLKTDSSVDTSTAGTYVVTYTVTDSSGNTKTIYRHVTVTE